MPEPSEILAGLTRIANDAFAIAVAWHVVAALFFVSVVLGGRVTNRTASLLLTAPLASVSALAWADGNPFNGAAFAVLASTLAWLARRAPSEPLQRGASWSVAAGTALVLFGWTYPHFLVARPPSAYLYGAPLGTIPCPTLSFATGATLLASGLGTREYRLVLAVAAAFYALFGMLRLGIAMDAALLVGAVSILALEPSATRAPAGTRNH